MRNHDEILKTLIKEQYPEATLLLKQITIDNEYAVGIEYLGLPRDLRSHGVGDHIMSHIADYAHTHSIPIATTPTDLFGSDVQRLTQFLTRHGFLRDVTQVSGYTMMLSPNI